MPDNLRKKIEKYADFDVLSRDPKVTAEIVKERLIDAGIKNVKIVKKEPVGEVIPIHYEIVIGRDTVAFIYKPVACHSYNVLMIHGKKVKIATIDTMLSFYLAFLYAKRPYYDPERILCMAKFLFDVQQKNRLQQKGLLKRFSITCYGHQESVEEMRSEKTAKFKELKDKKGTSEYEKWFLNYRPEVNTIKKHTQTNVKLNKPKITTKRKNIYNKTKKWRYSTFLNKKTKKSNEIY